MFRALPSAVLRRACAAAAGRLELVAVAAVVACFVALKTYALHHAASDDGIYFYDAVLASRGAIPYRDFFFAHPPLHLLPAVLLFGAIGGFDHTAAVMLPVGAALLAGLAVHAAARRAFGRLAAFVALASLLSSYDLLRASSHFTGINLSIAWLAAGQALTLARRPAAAGACYAAGVSTGVYVLPGALAAAAWLLLRGRREAARFAVGFGAVFVPIQATGLALAGGAYLEGVYGYHLLKPAAGGRSALDLLPRVAAENFWLLAAPLYALAVRAVAGRAPPAARFALAQVASYGVLLALLSRANTFYFLLLFPGCALLAGFVGSAVVERASAALRVRAPSRPPAVLVALLALGFWLHPSLGLRQTVAGGAEPRPGIAGLEAVDRVVKTVFWSPRPGLGDRVTGVRRYLCHEARIFDVAPRMAEVIRASPDRGALFGDSTSVPLTALLASRPIAADLVDTSALRFASGVLPPERAIAALEATWRPGGGPPLEWAVVCDRRGIAAVPELCRWLQEHFTCRQCFPTPDRGTYHLLRRNARAVDRAGSRSRGF